MNTDSKHRSRGFIYFLMFSTLSGFVVSGIGYVCDNSNILFIILTFFICISFIPLTFLVLEPVKRLYRQQEISKTFQTLHKISIINNNPISIKELQKAASLKISDSMNLQEVQYTIQNNQSSIEDCTSYLENFYTLLCSNFGTKILGLCILILPYMICLNGMRFNADLLGMESLYMNVIFLGVGQGVSCFVVMFFIDKVQRKRSIFIAQIIFIICGG